MLERARAERRWLTSGMDLGVRARRARVLDVDDRTFRIELDNLVLDRSQIHLNLEVEGSRYFFSVAPAEYQGAGSDGVANLELPSIVYRAERRDVPRNHLDDPGWAELEVAPGRWVRAVVRDESYEGVRVQIPGPGAVEVGARMRLRWPVVEGAGQTRFATVRHIVPGEGGLQVGLAVSAVPPAPEIPVHARRTILGDSPAERAWRQLRLATRVALDGPRMLAERTRLVRPRLPSVRVVDYHNEKGERLRAIIDSVGDTRHAPAIIIPPAWGRTKETLLPLAATLIRTFEAAGEPLVVVRYDERNRKGESFVDPKCRAPGREALNYTFSGAVDDIHTTLGFLAGSEDYAPSRVLLLTVSLAAIQGRRAVATDPTGTLAGWVSLVGMPDLQSSMRAVTGGVDWVYGLAQGLRFGPQELVGVLVDMDVAGPDTLRNHLGFFEDARRDMASIGVPVTWIHGEHDGWMSLERVRSLMSAGAGRGRKLLQVPTGHQLRNSREALETFQLVAEEAGMLLTGRRLRARAPDLVDLERRRRAERMRRPKAHVDLREFWQKYLLGRDGVVGMELMTATSLYRQFMDDQVGLASVSGGQRVLDLGAGTGDLGLRLAARRLEDPVSIYAVDFVPDALKRAHARLVAAGGSGSPSSFGVVSDLDRCDRVHLPFEDQSFDVAIASLLVSYLRNPVQLLQEAMRLLVPGGRIVLSAPRRDADSSKPFADTTHERSGEAVRKRFGPGVAQDFAGYQSDFLNSAARILELEDEGLFRFFDESELSEMLSAAGFVAVETKRGFGDPPQFSMARGVRPRNT